MLHRCLESGLEATRLGLGWRWDRRAGCSRPTAGSRQRLGQEAAKKQKTGQRAGARVGLSVCCSPKSKHITRPGFAYFDIFNCSARSLGRRNSGAM